MIFEQIVGLFVKINIKTAFKNDLQVFILFVLLGSKCMVYILQKKNLPLPLIHLTNLKHGTLIS